MRKTSKLPCKIVVKSRAPKKSCDFTSCSIRSLIFSVQNGTSCRGLEGVAIATNIVKNLFDSENLSFDGWRVTEIPVADISNEYPVAVVVCIENHVKRQAISINLKPDGTMYDCAADEYEEILCNTITEALNNPVSYYETVVEDSYFLG